MSVVYHYNEFLWPPIITDTDRARAVTVGLASFTQSAESAAQWNLIAARRSTAEHPAHNRRI